MNLHGLKEYLIGEGATVVGYAEVDEVLPAEISHLNRAVSIGVDRNLNANTLRILGKLLKKAERFLRDEGFRFLCIPPDSDRIKSTFVSKLYKHFSHKVAATCSGLGWIGRNGLLISPRYGPRLSLVTVLTDAPFKPDVPMAESQCGKCRLCVDMCPTRALSGEEWSMKNPFPELIDYSKCFTHKKNTRVISGKPNCGLCINICPYGRKKPGENTNNAIVISEDGE